MRAGGAATGEMAASLGRHAGRSEHVPGFARVLEEVVGNRLGASVYRRWVEQLGLAGDERVLEVGSGGGACSRHVAAALPAGRLTCLEIDPRWFSVARPRLSDRAARVEFVAGDITRWTRPGGFDVAIAHFVLHDLGAADRRRAVRNIARSLEPGGCLCLREPLAHGMSAEQLGGELLSAGFELAGDADLSRVPLMGPAVSGIWTLSAVGQRPYHSRVPFQSAAARCVLLGERGKEKCSNPRPRRSHR